jgi:hypothetical protein
MLSSAFLLHLSKKEKYTKSCQCNCEGDTDISLPTGIRQDVMVFVLLVIIDLAVIIYSLYCLFDLKLQWYITLLLIVLMFSPGFGFIAQIGVIMYYTLGRLPSQGRVPSHKSSPSGPVSKFHF